MKTKRNIIVLIAVCFCMSTYTQEIIWKQKASLPIANWAGSAVTYNNKIYYMGGGEEGKQVFEYDPAANSWLAKTMMPVGGSNFALAVVNGKIYAIGLGYPSLSEHIMYNPATDKWSAMASLPTPRFHTKAVEVDGKIYVMGGINSDFTTVLAKNEVYDPNTNTWEEKALLPVAKYSFGMAVMNGKIYVFGGYSQTGADVNKITSSIHEYDPVANSWKERASMPTARGDFGLAVINGKIVIAGGCISGSAGSTRVDIFDPVADSWEKGNPLPISNEYMGYTGFNDCIYIIAGTGGSGNGWKAYNTVYEGTLISTTGFKTNGITTGVRVYPNPTNGQFTMSFGSTPIEEGLVTIYNLQGALVFSKTYKNTPSATIDLTGNSAGMYVVKVIADGVSYEEKIVKE